MISGWWSQDQDGGIRMAMSGWRRQDSDVRMEVSGHRRRNGSIGTAVLGWCVGQLPWDGGVRKMASFWLRQDAYSRMIDFFNISVCFLLCMSLFPSLSEKE